MKKSMLLLGLVIACAPFVGCGKTESASTTPATEAPAKATGITEVFLNDTENPTSSKDSFPPTVEKLHVGFKFENVPNGDKFRGVWICEQSNEAPPNFQIGEATVEVGALTNSGSFSLSKPTKGFPVGNYRIDIFWNDKVTKSLRFTIVK